MKKIIKILSIIIIFICIFIILIRLFIVDYKLVDGNSMLNTIKKGDVVIIDKINDNFNRYDIVAVKLDNYVVKRIIGLPGDKIECKGGKIYINDNIISENYVNGVTEDFQPLIIPNNEYFVLGDNRENSIDSRVYGTIKLNNIVGKIIKIL